MTRSDRPSRFLRSRPAAPARRSGARGFTITELLVVIAIIALLTGLLLVALETARSRSKAASSEATMAAFAAGCEAFQQQFDQLPGVVPDNVLAADAVSNGGVPQITGTQNALLHLVGGYEVRSGAIADGDFQHVNPAAAEIDLTFTTGVAPVLRLLVDIDRIGEGPRIRDKQYEPFFTPSPGTLVTVENLQVQDPDLELPHVVDAWGQPIAYMRRSRTLGGLIDDPASGGAGARGQFIPTMLVPYMSASQLGRGGEDQVLAGGNPDGSILSSLGGGGAYVQSVNNLIAMIRQPALDDQARGTFVLFSAGADGIFFSAQDGLGTPDEPIDDLADYALNVAPLPADVAGEYDDIIRFGGA